MATLRELIIKISANSQSFQTEISRASRMGSDYYKTMQNGGRQAAAASKETQKALAEVTSQLNSAKASAVGMAGAFAGAFATGHLIALADEWNSVNARLKQASKSTDDFQVSQRALMDISQRTGTSFSDNASLFARSAASMREFGYGSQDVLKVTEAISTGLKLSGASTSEASSVITQFSQALAQGVLRGEEFNSVNENGDRVIRALASGMGVARKDLKAMADQGQLTADKVVPALISQLGTLRSEYQSMPQTVSAATTKIENAFMAWVGGANEASGATNALVGVLNSVSTNIDTVAAAAGALAAIGGAKYFGGMLDDVGSQTAKLIEARKNEIALSDARAQAALQLQRKAAAEAIASERAYQLAQMELELAKNTNAEATATQNAITKRRAMISANASLVQSNRAVASSQESLNAATSVMGLARTGAAGLLTLVGGLPGLLMLGAGAWYTMYQNQEQARQSARDYANQIDVIREKTANMSLSEADDSRKQSIDALAEQNRLIVEQETKTKGLIKQIEDLNKASTDTSLNDANRENIVRAVAIATGDLAVEQERLNQLREKANAIQQSLSLNENRHNDLIRDQAWRQNQAYQSLLLMNGQHTEFNRLLGLGNELLMQRQGLGNGPVRVAQSDLNQKQEAALTKSRQDLELSRLKGEEKERAKLGFAADALGLTNDPQYQTGRQEIINNGLEEWRNTEANKKKPKGPKTDEEKAEDTFKRLNKQQREQIALAGQSTEIAKIKYQISQGELTSLSDAQKQMLLQNATLIDQKNIQEKLNSFREGLADSNAAARERGDIDFSGAGIGDDARDRMKEIADIRSEFLKQQRDLQRDFNSGQIPEDQYKQQTQALSDALDERIKIQQDYYEKLDEQRSDWMGGVSDALANYVDEATNYSQIAADATSSILDSATSELSEGFKSMIDGSKTVTESLSDMFAGFGEAVIDALVKMGAQWLVYQAVQLMVGKTTQASAGSTLLANAQAMAKMAELNAYASTAAIPIVGPAAAPAAAGLAAAFAEPLAASVGALSLAGMAHSGIDKVPETGTWLLQKGERVVTASTSAKLDATLEKVQSVRQSAGGGSVHIQNSFTGKPDDATMAAIDSRNRQLVTSIRKEMAAQVVKPTNEFGRALNGFYGRTRKE